MHLLYLFLDCTINNRALNHYNIMALNHYNGMIEGMDTVLAVILKSGSAYPRSPIGATGSSGGSSRSVSPTEGTTRRDYYGVGL